MADTMNLRRSWMILPAHQPEEAMRFQEYQPDVTVLDLEYSVPPKYKETTRNNLVNLLRQVSNSETETFVRVDRETRWADVRAAVYPGIKGVILPGPEEPEEVTDLDELIGKMEKERGVTPDTTEIVLMLESAKGFWNIASLAEASPRVTALGLGRIDLTMRLGPVPQGEFRLYRYIMTRTLVAARMLNKQPLGAFFKPGSRGGVASKEDTLKAANEAMLMGFTGCICATPEQVAPVNEGFTLAKDAIKR